MEIIYKEIDNELLEQIINDYGGKEERERYSMPFEKIIRGHILLENGCFSIVALCGGKPVGFISIQTKTLEQPLNDKKDACISIIEVDIKYRRQGIGKKLVSLTEEWAAKNGLSQIRAWSSRDKIEAISMWYALKYCVCPAKIWVEWCKEVVDGYYVVKKMNLNN